MVTNGPGTVSEKPTSGLDGKFDNFDFTKEESEEGYKNFSVIKCKIKSIEWLYLAAKGHRRALINFEGSKKIYLVSSLIIFYIFWKNQHNVFHFLNGFNFFICYFSKNSTGTAYYKRIIWNNFVFRN